MSREIKFRAWDYNTNTMVYPYSELEITFCFDKVGLSVYHNNGQEMSSFELMQYTGLKDRNDKEIYEGDILFKDGYWSIRIEYDKGGFMVRDLDKIRYNNKCLNWNIGSFDLSGWEIIGNIYENNELLEEI